MTKTMGQVKLRLAQPEDVANIAGLLTQTFYAQTGWRGLFSPILKLGLCYDIASRLQLADRDKYQCWVAEIYSAQEHSRATSMSPKIVGTVEVGIRSLSIQQIFIPTQAYISNLAVNREYRRRGIAQQLIEKCEAAAHSWQQNDIFLHVRQDNAIAIALYQKLGYRQNPQQFPMDRSRKLMSKGI